MYRAIDGARLEHGLSWSALSRQVGVAASTIRRFERAADAEADGVLTLIAWVGLPPERFLVNRPPAEERLPMLDGGVIRADTTLLAELSGTVRPGGRTTIQRLARTARTHSRTLASLAHWSAA